MRSSLRAAVPALLLLAPLSACSDDASAGDNTSPSDAAASEGPCTYEPDGTSSDVELPPSQPTASGQVPVTMTTSVGEFKATLDADRAPCTVNSFVSLAEQEYFDGTSCHRLTTRPGFQVLQCGDPDGTGMGGPGYTVPAEFDGTETYPAGTLAMARAQDPDSGGSQFFIVYGDTGLDPSYTVFGTVDADTVARIAKAAEAGVTPEMGPEDGRPKTPVTFETVSVD
ncbi:peptidylprolyl isomerase [Nocardioides sp.]|nr:peptidylprolyl isomerase [Nocardioides sp.]